MSITAVINIHLWDHLGRIRSIAVESIYSSQERTLVPDSFSPKKVSLTPPPLSPSCSSLSSDNAVFTISYLRLSVCDMIGSLLIVSAALGVYGLLMMSFITPYVAVYHINSHG